MSTENMEAPEIYSGQVGVEIVPDMRKLRSFAKDFIALVDSYWPEETGSPLATQSRQTGNCDSPTPDMPRLRHHSNSSDCRSAPSQHERPSVSTGHRSPY